MSNLTETTVHTSSPVVTPTTSHIPSTTSTEPTTPTTSHTPSSTSTTSSTTSSSEPPPVTSSEPPPPVTSTTSDPPPQTSSIETTPIPTTTEEPPPTTTPSPPPPPPTSTDPTSTPPPNTSTTTSTSSTSTSQHSTSSQSGTTRTSVTWVTPSSTRTSSAPSKSSTGAAAAGSKADVGAIAGGAAGGAVGLVILLAAAFFLFRAYKRKKRSSWKPDMFDPRGSVYYKEGVTMDLDNEMDDSTYSHDSPAATTNHRSTSWESGRAVAAAAPSLPSLASLPAAAVASHAGHTRSPSWENTYNPNTAYAPNAYYDPHADQQMYAAPPPQPRLSSEDMYGYSPAHASGYADPYNPQAPLPLSASEAKWREAAGLVHGIHAQAPLAFPVPTPPAGYNLEHVAAMPPAAASMATLNRAGRSTSTLASVYEDASGENDGAPPRQQSPSPASSNPSGTTSVNSGSNLRANAGPLGDVPLSPTAAALPYGYNEFGQREPRAAYRPVSHSFGYDTERSSIDTARTGTATGRTSFETARGDPDTGATGYAL